MPDCITCRDTPAAPLPRMLHATIMPLPANGIAIQLDSQSWEPTSLFTCQIDHSEDLRIASNQTQHPSEHAVIAWIGRPPGFGRRNVLSLSLPSADQQA